MCDGEYVRGDNLIPTPCLSISLMDLEDKCTEEEEKEEEEEEKSWWNSSSLTIFQPKRAE